MMFSGAYSGRRVLVTGHNGFKGSWLSLWLSTLGADLAGVSLPADTTPNHWDLLGLAIREHLGDIRDAAWLREVITQESPEVVFHLAAQSLVRRSYRAPLDTWSTNVMGTANVLEACRASPSVKAIVVITTDKVYENREWCWGYRENDRLGGHDPYSASKAASELVASSYRQALYGNSGALIASARAGNVIGGGDWCEDRLIPDLVRAVATRESLLVRSPNSTRPWQHVLECLSGYLVLGERLLSGDARYAEPWNFGPDVADNRSVSNILDQFSKHWGGVKWTTTEGHKPHEANLLYLDNSKAKAALNWHPVWNLAQTVAATADWYRSHLESGAVISSAQLAKYVDTARSEDLAWALS